MKEQKEISELLPHGIDEENYVYYIVVYRRRSLLTRPFCGKFYYGVMGIIHPYQATRKIKGWETLPGLYTNPNEATEKAKEAWAIHSHPLLVLLHGLFHPSLIRYRSKWVKEWEGSFWER